MGDEGGGVGDGGRGEGDGGELGEGGGGDGDGGGGDGEGGGSEGSGGGSEGDDGGGDGGDGGGGLGEHCGSGVLSMGSPSRHFPFPFFHSHSCLFPLLSSVQALRHSCLPFESLHFVAAGSKHVPGASGGGAGGEDGGGDGDWQHASQQLSESFFPF